MKLLFATVAIFLFAPNTAYLQVTCFSYAGGVLSCDGPRGNTTITPLSPSQGVILSDRYGMEPYTIMPPSSSAPSRPDGIEDPVLSPGELFGDTFPSR